MSDPAMAASVSGDSRVVIAGAGGFGREVHAWLTASPRFLSAHSVSEMVFIDDSTPEVPVPAEVISTISGYVPELNDRVVCAIGDPVTRRNVVTQLNERETRFLTFVDDRAVLGDNVALGDGVVICPAAVVTCDITLGDHVHVNINCSIGHDVTVGDFATLSPGCNLMGGVEVGAGVFVGTAATVIPGKSIGRGSIIGAGSVVLKDVPQGVTSFGNPSTTFKVHDVAF